VSYYLDLAFNGVVFGCMYALMAVGLTLVYGLLRILHIAHAAVYAFGAYVAVIVANGSGSLMLGLAASLAAAALLGMAIYRVLYQPLLAYPPYVAMIASIGLLVLMEDGFRIAFGEQGLTFAHNPYPTQLMSLRGSRSTLCRSPSSAPPPSASSCSPCSLRGRASGSVGARPCPTRPWWPASG
jgi:branched-chain amino acid transport system permease protein